MNEDTGYRNANSVRAIQIIRSDECHNIGCRYVSICKRMSSAQNIVGRDQGSSTEAIQVTDDQTNLVRYYVIGSVLASNDSATS